MPNKATRERQRARKTEAETKEAEIVSQNSAASEPASSTATSTPQLPTAEEPRRDSGHGGQVAGLVLRPMPVAATNSVAVAPASVWGTSRAATMNSSVTTVSGNVWGTVATANRATSKSEIIITTVKLVAETENVASASAWTSIPGTTASSSTSRSDAASTSSKKGDKWQKHSLAHDITGPIKFYRATDRFGSFAPDHTLRNAFLVHEEDIDRFLPLGNKLELDCLHQKRATRKCVFKSIEQMLFCWKAQIAGLEERMRKIYSKPEPASYLAITQGWMRDDGLEPCVGKRGQGGELEVLSFFQGEERDLIKGLCDMAVYCKYYTPLVEGDGAHVDLVRRLLATGDKQLLYCNPTDRIAGMGSSVEQADANESSWGENLLGKALMKLRDAKDEEGGSKLAAHLAKMEVKMVEREEMKANGDDQW